MKSGKEEANRSRSSSKVAKVFRSFCQYITNFQFCQAQFLSNSIWFGSSLDVSNSKENKKLAASLKFHENSMTSKPNQTINQHLSTLLFCFPK